DVERAPLDLLHPHRAARVLRAVQLDHGVREPGKRQQVETHLPAGLAHDAAARDDIVEAVPDRTVVSAKHLVGEGDCADPHTVAPGVHQPRQHARTTAVRVDVDGGGWMPGADLPCRVDQRVVACRWLAFAALPEGDDAGVFTAQV